MLNTFNLDYVVKKQLGHADSLDPRATKLFDKVLSISGKNWFKRLIGYSRPILVLENIMELNANANNRHYVGSQTVKIIDIHGTIERDTDFDYDFAPLKQEIELRWCKVATAMLRGIDLSPVELIQVGKEYFVKDGHHRISVARTLGFDYIDAIVEVWE